MRERVGEGVWVRGNVLCSHIALFVSVYVREREWVGVCECAGVYRVPILLCL